MNADGFVEVNRNYPGKRAIQMINDFHDYDSWDHRSKVITVVQIRSEMLDGKNVELYATSFFKIEDEKILSLAEYWADTYPAPEWRRQWVERY